MSHSDLEVALKLLGGKIISHIDVTSYEKYFICFHYKLTSSVVFDAIIAPL